MCPSLQKEPSESYAEAQYAWVTCLFSEAPEKRNGLGPVLHRAHVLYLFFFASHLEFAPKSSLSEVSGHFWNSNKVGKVGWLCPT
jgi:hypothetical protein